MGLTIGPYQNFVAGMKIQVHPDRVLHKRFIYNSLDLLGDIGGLREALRFVGVLIINAFGMANALNGYLVQSIFFSPTSGARKDNRTVLDDEKKVNQWEVRSLIKSRSSFKVLSDSFWLRLCGDPCSKERRKRRLL